MFFEEKKLFIKKNLMKNDVVITSKSISIIPKNILKTYFFVEFIIFFYLLFSLFSVLYFHRKKMKNEKLYAKSAQFKIFPKFNFKRKKSYLF